VTTWAIEALNISILLISTAVMCIFGGLLHAPAATPKHEYDNDKVGLHDEVQTTVETRQIVSSCYSSSHVNPLQVWQVLQVPCIAKMRVQEGRFAVYSIRGTRCGDLLLANAGILEEWS
jgi:hypothetical protein